MDDTTEDGGVRLGLRPDWDDHRQRFTHDDKLAMAETCTAFAAGEAKVRHRHGLSCDELRDVLLDVNVEQCPHCKVWTDSFNLLGPDDEVDGRCDNCRPREE